MKTDLRRMACAALFLVCLPLFAARGAAPMVTLKFVPQEGVASDAPTFPEGFVDKSATLRVEDARTIADKTIIGEGTDDDDKKFSIHTSSDVAAFANEVLAGVAGQWGVKSGPTGDRALTMKVTRFMVSESNKAVGSMYSGDVSVTYTLRDAAGRTLASGAVAGDTKRYGRARSIENYNEVLSDALKEAYANVFNESALQNAWVSGKASAGGAAAAAAAPAPCEDLNPEQRLKRLDDLLKKGIITKEEYASQRAEIVKKL